MKWRQSIVYLVVLLLAGGYFYYFEVVKKSEKESAERESKRVLSFQAGSVKKLEITPAADKSIRIEKDGNWKITEPIEADGDKLTLEGIVASASNLMMMREIAPSPPDLAPFGLTEPLLKVRVLAEDRWHELLFGENNPTGEGRYAKIASKPNVFLVAEANFNAINKNLKDVRKKDLFAFQLEDVTGLEIAWAGGTVFSVASADEGRTWKSPAAPDVTIKPSKVSNVLEQIRWLKATAFLENRPDNLAAHGLDPAAVTVGIKLRDERSVGLKLGAVDEVKRQVAAVGTELPAVVEVSAGILQDIPKDVKGLEDRSLVSIDWDAVKQFKWRKGDAAGHLVRLDKNKWGVKKDDGQPREFKDSWRAGSLLWDFRDTEFESRIESPGPASVKPWGRVELLDDARVMAVISWDKPAAPVDGLVPVRVEKDGAAGEVKIKLDALQRIEDDLDHMVKAEQAKPAP
ncbi:MAG TPA: DUF4340 domain-containing protein [Syntrophobacter fumaroxidans]|nr:DUF4340 domain-containing protein [Syntrophobacter fumaroxidans]